MPLDQYALTTLAAVKTSLGITDSSQDAVLEDFINFTSAIIESATQRKFKVRTYTDEKHNGPEDHSLILNNYPIVSVDSVYFDVTRVFAADTLISVDDYAIEFEEGIITMVGGPWGHPYFGKGAQAIKATYQAGYSHIPYDVERACIMLVMYYRDNERQLGIKSISMGSFSQSFGDMSKMPPAVQAILSMYANRYIGI